MSRFVANAWKVVIAGMVIVGLIVVPAQLASADTIITVTTTTDGGAGSLREAISTANGAGAPVTIVLGASQTYDLTTCAADPEDANVSGDLDLTASVTVALTGNNSTIRQTCTNARVFDHRGPGSLHLDALTLTGGNYTSGPYPNASTEAAGLGLRSSAALEANRLTVTATVGQGTMSRVGAAVYLEGTSGASFDLSSISANAAAGILDASTSATDLTITRSTISDNVGSTLPLTGIEIRPSNGVTVVTRRLDIADSTLERNTGPTMPIPPVWPPANGCCNGVGALSVPLDDAETKLSANNVVVRNNASFRGAVFGGKIVMSDSLIEDNWAGAGGGVGGFVELHRVTIRGNNAPIGGGGIAGHGLVEDSTISGNQSPPLPPGAGGNGHAGGILVDGPMTIRRSTITGNTAKHGGGIWVTSDAGFDSVDRTAVLTLVDSTVADNISTDDANGPHEIELVASTPAPSATVSRSIISHQVGPGSACAANGFTLASSGFNVITDNSCFISPQPSDLTSASPPLLDPLADNGGPTKTRLPATGSPVVDRIPTSDPGCADADQRGISRPQGPGCDVGAVEAAKSGYHPVSPVRIVDTRTGQGTTAQRFGPGESRSFALPAEINGRAAAVVLNVTAANASAASHLTLWPTGRTKPVASNVNFPAHQNVAGLTTVATGTTAAPVSVFNNTGSTDVIVDLAGWYDNGVDDGSGAGASAAAPATCPCGDGFTATTPKRVLDTRPGTNVGGPATPFGPGETRTLQIAGVQGIPADATSVAINLTITGATSASHLTAWPTGSPAPVVSNLNWSAGTTIANLAIVKLGPDGAIEVRNNQGSVDVIADVAGAFTSGPAGSRFTVVSPKRILDTREAGNPIGPGATRTVSSPALPDGADAAVIDLTGVGPSADTHLTAWPANAALPLASNLNLPAGATRANLATIALAPNADFNLYNNSGSTHVVADLAGYYG